MKCILCLLRLHGRNLAVLIGPDVEKGKLKPGIVSPTCLRHDYINILMPVAVHNAVNCFLGEKKNQHILSSFMIYKYMYELHLTEVLLINNTKMKMYVCAGV